MRNSLRAGVWLAFPLLVACADELPTLTEATPPPFSSVTTAALPAVRFSEIHYDNTGTDTGETIEISGPAGTDLTGWQVVLYNGNGGATYNTRTLSGTIPATCDERGVVVLTYPTDGIQNGSPDGMALVNAAGAVVEFLSYEGVFAATNGVALGTTSVDIGVAEVSTTPVGQSLQRSGADAWSGPKAGTFGACNDDDEPPPPGGTFISEMHYDNALVDAGEAIEIESDAGTDLTGWQLVLYNGNGGAPYHTTTLTGTISNLCTGRGVLVVTYPENGIQNGSPDGVALVNAAGTVVQFLSYEGTFTAVGGAATGMVSTDIGVSEPGTNALGTSLQRTNGVWAAPQTSSFGACNGTVVGPPPSTISITGRSAAEDPALPVGYQDQLFATLRDGSGVVVETTFTWSSDTPALASIASNGVVTALAAGTAVLRATATDGTTATISLPTRVAVASTTAAYAGNTEFGTPADVTPADEFLIVHPQFTSSYNRFRSTPNWVSYNMEATHFGSEDRCDCFTHDPTLPASFPLVTTADYTGAGTVAGFGIDRGHLVRSADRTAGSLDNAVTFLFSNIIPQTADNNQGPWSDLELHLGNLARNQNREVYVVTGVAGSNGTVKNEGRIIIPASVWKVAVIMDRDEGLAAVQSWRDVEVIAVLMPNVPGIRNHDWTQYQTSVNAVEAASGYDLLALLPDGIENTVESGRPPVAALNGPFTGAEGGAIALSGAASLDPDGDVLTYEWDFGDGSTGTGSTAAHTYTQDGVYTVTLTVRDPFGYDNTTTSSATVTNVAPAIAAFDGAALIAGETYSASGSFTDPGADRWSATVDYALGSGPQALPLVGKTFSLSRLYAAPGTFTIAVRVTDDDVTSTRTATVQVKPLAEALADVGGAVDRLVDDGTLNAGQGNALHAKLRAAGAQIERGNTRPAVQQLRAFIHQVQAFLRAGKLDDDAAEALTAEAERIIQVL